MADTESSSFAKYVGAVVFGIAITYAYVHFGYEPPPALQIAGKAKSEAIVATAEFDLYSPVADDNMRQRAMAVVLGQQPELLIELNQELDNQILFELLRRKALRKAKQLKQEMSAYDKALDQPALRARLEAKYNVADTHRLKHSMMLAAIKDTPFLYWYLKNQFPVSTEDGFVEIVMASYQNEMRRPKMALRDQLPRAQH